MILGMPRFVGRIPTNKWNSRAGPALLAADVRLEQPTNYELGVDLDAADLDAAYERVTQALAGAGVELQRDDFAMPLYRVGPGQIVVGPPE